MSTPAATASLQNPFEQARLQLVRRILEMRAPAAHAIADASDHIREAANIFDEWLAAIGGGIADRVNVDVDARVFQGAFLGAVDGNATYEVECVVERAGQFRTLRRAF